MLEEASRMPKETDTSLITKMHNYFADEKSELYSKYYGYNRLKKNKFTIKHYAGDVIYDVNGFVEKNKDKLNIVLGSIVSHGFIAELFMIHTEEAITIKKRESRRKNRGRTITGKFRKQLDVLCRKLSICYPQYIRCLRPNHEKKPAIFRTRMILNQMKHSGLMEAIHIRRSGYPYRVDYTHFVRKFRMCLPIDELKKCPKEDALATQFIVSALGKQLDAEQLQMGKTKIFMRESLRQTLHNIRMDILQKTVRRIEPIIKARYLFKQMKKMHAECVEAITTRDFEKLHACLEIAEGSDIVLCIHKQVQDLAHYLLEETHLVDSMRKATMSGHVEEVEAIYVQLERFEIDFPCNTRSDTYRTFRESLQAAHDTLVQKKKCIQQLSEAMMHEDLQSLRDALAHCSESKISSPEISVAESLLIQLEQEEKLLADIENVIKKGEAPEIERAYLELEKKIDNATTTLKIKEVMQKAKTKIEAKYARECDDILYMKERGQKDAKELQENLVKRIELLQLMDVKKTCLKYVNTQLGMKKENKHLVAAELVRTHSHIELDLQLSNEIKKKPPDIKKITKLLEEAEAANFESSNVRIARKIKKSIEEKKEVCKAIRYSINEVQFDKLKVLLKRANQMGVDEPELISEAREYCFGLKEEDHLERKLSRAIETKDVNRLATLLEEAEEKSVNGNFVTEAQVQLAKYNSSLLLSPLHKTRSTSGEISSHTELVERAYHAFIKLRKKYPFSKLPLLRSETDYWKIKSRKHKGKKPTDCDSNWLVWGRQDLVRSMTYLVSPTTESSKIAKKRARTKALQIFKIIRGFMGDHYHAYQDTLPISILSSGLQESALRDEIFSQLIKQTTNNPNELSSNLGLKLIYMCLTSFKPSNQMSLYLLSHLASFAPDTLGDSINWDTSTDIAIQCWSAFVKGVKSTKITIEQITDIRNGVFESFEVENLPETNANIFYKTFKNCSSFLIPIVQNVESDAPNILAFATSMSMSISSGKGRSRTISRTGKKNKSAKSRDRLTNLTHRGEVKQENRISNRSRSQSHTTVPVHRRIRNSNVGKKIKNKSRKDLIHMMRRVNKDIHKKPRKRTPSALKLFGGKLKMACSLKGSLYSNLPTVVVTCIEQLKKEGMKWEGIFRVPGRNVLIQELRKSFEEGKIPDLDECVHSVAGVLKLYFRELSDPLITYQGVGEKLFEIEEQDIALEVKYENIRKALQQLDSFHLDTLNYLIKFLTEVCEFSDENLMPPKNCAIVFAPGLVRKPDSKNSVMEINDVIALMDKAQNIVIMLIEGYSVIFPNGPIVPIQKHTDDLSILSKRITVWCRLPELLEKKVEFKIIIKADLKTEIQILLDKAIEKCREKALINKDSSHLGKFAIAHIGSKTPLINTKTIEEVMKDNDPQFWLILEISSPTENDSTTKKERQESAISNSIGLKKLMGNQERFSGADLVTALVEHKLASSRKEAVTQCQNYMEYSSIVPIASSTSEDFIFQDRRDLFFSIDDTLEEMKRSSLTAVIENDNEENFSTELCTVRIKIPGGEFMTLEVSPKVDVRNILKKVFENMKTTSGIDHDPILYILTLAYSDNALPLTHTLEEILAKLSPVRLVELWLTKRSRKSRSKDSRSFSASSLLSLLAATPIMSPSINTTKIPASPMSANIEKRKKRVKKRGQSCGSIVSPTFKSKKITQNTEPFY